MVFGIGLPIAMACVAGVAGCTIGGTSGVEMWVAEPGLSGLRWGRARTAAGEAGTPRASRRRVRLSGAINETVSFQFAVRAGGQVIANPRFGIEPLTSTNARIEASEVRLFRMHRVRVDGFPGWHIRSILPGRREPRPLDVLVPLSAPRGGLPASLVPGETYQFWVDLRIPKGAFEGTYTARLELTSGEERVASVDVELTVWPIILPDKPDIPIIAEVDHRTLFRHHVEYGGHPVSLLTDDWRDAPTRNKLDSVLRSTMRCLQSHGLTPVLPQLLPPVQIGASGGVTIDWAPYDAVVEPFMNGRAFANRVPSRYWPIPVSGALSPQRRDQSPSSEYAEMLRQYLTQCASHFAEKRWLERSYAIVPGAARPNARSVRALQEFATASRGTGQRITVASQLWPQDMAPYGWLGYAGSAFSDGIDIWLPPAQFFDVVAMANEQVAGKRIWLAVDRPPYSGSIAVHASEAYARVLTWQADRLGAEAVYLGGINRWPDSDRSATAEDCIRADPNVLLYPGGPFGLDEPVASVRLKHLRRSLQDGAYRRVLRDQGLEHVAAALATSLAPYAGSDSYRTHFADGWPTGHVDNPAMFDLARDIMADELVNRSLGRAATRQTGDFARTAAWRRFMLATRTLRLYVDGTRMRLTGTRTEWEADVECTLTIVNRTRVPITGTIGFIDPPSAQWTMLDENQAVGSIGPNSSRRVTLTARLTGLPTEPGGVMYLPIEFTTLQGAVHRCEARVSCITAVPFDGSVRIDGDLSDWPPGIANVASEFRLISEEPTEGPGEVAGRPPRATMAFVRRDGEYLYLAINSEFDGRAFRSASLSNSVEYDDQIPVGEELVEVLIDPLNAGTRSPGDLYHIVVKPSGTYLTERGIRFDPPCGLRAPWPADIVVSARVANDRWTAELRIPLASFGVGAAEHTIWGLNITRYDASRQEFSTWSGAMGNAYDPLSLGNLYVP